MQKVLLIRTFNEIASEKCSFLHPNTMKIAAVEVAHTVLGTAWLGQRNGSF